MSECVVRMEMPNDCWDCPCVNGEYGYCQADEEKRQIEEPVCARKSNGRPSWCPILCQLPDGHGRPGDLDELKNWLVAQIEHYKRFDYGAICSTMVSAYETVCKVIDSMTAIVPADEYPAYMSQWLGKAISAERSET